MQQKEPLFKGMTRPAMIFGIPLMPFMGTMLIGFVFSVWVDLRFLFVLIPAFIIMKIMTLKDDFIFRLIFLKLKFGKSSVNKNFFGAKTFNTIRYRKMSRNFPKISFTALDNNPSLQEFIPYSSMIDNSIVLTKDYMLLTSFKINGVPFELEDASTIDKDKNILEMILKSFANEPLGFYVHTARHDIEDRFNSSFENSYLNDVEEKYFNSFEKGSLKNNALFLTLVFNPLKTRLEQTSFINSSYQKKKDELLGYKSKMNEYVGRIEQNLKSFKPIKLGVYEENNIKYSSQLEFYNFLISGKFTKVRALNAPINEYLTGALKNLQFNSDMMQLNFNNDEKKFARAIEIKDYNKETFSGILDTLMNLNINYIMTQSYTTEKKVEAKDSLQKQKKSLEGVEDDAESQIFELEEALDQLVSGDISFGKYHFSLVVFGDTVQETKDNTNKAITVMNEAGFLVTLANIALPATYFAQFPSNFELRPRISMLSSKNYASLIALHNFPKGKRDKNCWGEAITILKTPNKQPYYLNLHANKGKDDFGKFYLGNSLLVGESGGGKTALMTFIMAQMQKYNKVNSFPENIPDEKKKQTTIYLDKDYGALGVILASGGRYINIENGEPTGFNPLMVENTPVNIKNILNLIKILITRNGEMITPFDEQRLSNAVTFVMDNFEREERKYGISLVLENLTEDIYDANSIKSRLSLWSKGKKFGWVFDNENDILDFPDNIDIFGIDGTNFLDDLEVSPAISYYILWRVLTQVDGRRFVLFIDELWKWISDTRVAQETKNKLKTIRKENGLFIMGTQSVEDVTESEISRAIIEQCSTFFLLSNTKATENDYVQGLGCTTKEFKKIKEFNPDAYQFLIKRGKENVIASLDLSSIGDENIKILSTGSAYVDDIKRIMNNDKKSLNERIENLKNFYKTERN